MRNLKFLSVVESGLLSTSRHNDRCLEILFIGHLENTNYINLDNITIYNKCLVQARFFCFLGASGCPTAAPKNRKGEFMKSKVSLIIKIIITISIILSGLVVLTNWRLNGIHIFGLDISAEEVNMFVDSSGSYLFLAFSAIVILIIWGVWVGRRTIAKRKEK